MKRSPVDHNQVLEYIKNRDKSCPILSRDIERFLEISGPQVRDAVRTLRRAGEPIVATENGYFYAQNTEEVNILVADLSARIASLSQTKSAIIKKAYERFQLQGSLFTGQSGAGVSGIESGSEEASQGCGITEPSRRQVFPVHVDRREVASERDAERGEVLSSVMSLEELIGV